MNLLKFMLKHMYYWRARYYLRFDAKVIANKVYKSHFKRDINWNKPTDLIEKIQWLQMYSDTGLWTICADKYLVREFVKEKGCGEVLNEVYGMWFNANDIDWSQLPHSFVLKTNHSSGQVILVKDKSKLDKIQTINKLQKWLKIFYGYRSAQLHYTKIKPCIIAEKLFVNTKEPDKSLIDYKIHCFHGVPEDVLVVSNRTRNSYNLSLYNLEWNNITKKALNRENIHYHDAELDKPSSLDQMLEVAKKLSKDIPQVRVDFYDIDDKAVFGEMTFTTGFGSHTEEYYKYYGSKIDLTKVEKLHRPNFI